MTGQRHDRNGLDGWPELISLIGRNMFSRIGRHLKQFIAATILSLFLPIITFGTASAGPLSIKTTILALEGARVALEGAIAAASSANMKVSIAVVDRSGNLLAFVRRDGAMTASIENAVLKARTAAQLGKSTKDLQDLVDGGRPSLLSAQGISPMQGGMPLFVDGELVGGIGASGGPSDKDEMVANAGAIALNDRLSNPHR